jgi:hypothetical protein
MYCNVRGLLIVAFPNAPKRRSARGAKKIRTHCTEVSKSINPVCLFICSHCQVSENISKSGVWLAPNGCINIILAYISISVNMYFKIAALLSEFVHQI